MNYLLSHGFLYSWSKLDFKKPCIVSKNKNVSFLTCFNESEHLAKLLYYQYHVGPLCQLFLYCNFCVYSEIICVLAALRLGCPFTPMDEYFLDIRFSQIVSTYSNLFVIIIDMFPKKDKLILKLEKDGIPYLVLSGGENLFQYVSNTNFPVIHYPLLVPKEKWQDYHPLMEKNELVVEEYNPWKCNLNYPLYVFYTSGSTGKPNGVIGSHENFIYRLLFQLKMFPYKDEEKMAFRRTPFVFIDSLIEIFYPLFSEIPIYCDENTIQQVNIIERIQKSLDFPISRIVLLPCQLQLIIKCCPKLWSTLKIIFISGEAATWKLMEMFKQRFSTIVLVNLYGSTEVSGDVTFCQLHPWSLMIPTDIFAPIGQIMDENTFQMINNENTENCGELIVSGKHVCMGYYKNDEKNKNSFIHDSNTIWFRTGDWVKQNRENLLLTWLGRTDYQVKIRGIRVELEEIEEIIKQKLNISFHDLAIITHEMELVLCLHEQAMKIKQGEKNKEQTIKTMLFSFLPLHMVPTHIIFLPSIAKTSSGKINRSELSLVVSNYFSTFSSVVVSVKRKYTESLLSRFIQILVECIAFSTHLKFTNNSVPDWFQYTWIELGGNSMTAMMVLWRIQHEILVGSTKSLLTLAILAYQPLIDVFSFLSTNIHRLESSQDDSDGGTEKIMLEQLAKSSHHLYSDCLFTISGLIPNWIPSKLDFVHPNIVLTEKWQHKLERCVDKEVLVVQFGENPGNIVVYVGSYGGDFFCLHSESGEIIWQIHFGMSISTSFFFNQRLYVPTNTIYYYEKGLIQLQREDGCTSTLWCLMPDSGNMVWSVGLDGHVSSPPISVGTYLYVGSYAGILYQIDSINGIVDKKLNNLDGIHASPLYVEIFSQLIVCTMTGKIHVILLQEEEMILLFTFYHGIQIERNPICGKAPNQIVAIDINGQIICCSLSPFPDFLYLDDSDNNFRYSCCQGKVKCIKKNQVCWERNLPLSFRITPLLVSSSCLVVGSEKGEICCLCAKTGKILSKLQIAQEIHCSPILVRLHENEALVAMGSRDDKLHLISICFS